MSIPHLKIPGHRTQLGDSEPDECFVDNTVYCYKLVDGKEVPTGTIPPYPEGWDIPRWLKKKNEEEAEMAKISTEDKNAIIAQYKEIKAADPERSMNSIAKEIEVPVSSLHQWLNQKPKKELPLPSAEQLKKDYIEFDCKINTVARKYGISWAKCKDLLKHAGLIDGMNQPKIEVIKKQLKAEPENKVEPEEEKTKAEHERIMASMGVIINPEPTEPEPNDNDFTVQDEEPIPYTVLPKEVVTEHHVIATEIATLLDAKRADYGVNNISKFGAKDVLVRVSDKVERLINLTWETDKEPNFESVEDTWRDIAGYAILALLELNKDWAGDEPIPYKVSEEA